MSLLRFLLRASPWLVSSAFVTSVASGLASTYLVSLINELLTRSSGDSSELALRFGGTCALLLALRWASHTQFVRSSEQALAQLRTQLSRYFAEMPYRELERLGWARVQAILTEDVATVSGFFVTVPELAMSGAVVLGSVLYLGWLSPSVLAFALVLLGLGSLGYHIAHLRALEHLRIARSQEDELFRHFRGLVDGAKELKLHRRRRSAFLREVLEPGIERVRHHHTLGFGIYVGCTSWGTFLFFVLIGAVLFVGKRMGLESQVVSGYALMFLYMMLPLESLLGALPNINLARVALERIGALGMSPSFAGVPVLPADPSSTSAFAELRLEQVTHRYQRDTEDGVFTLGPIDLELRRAEVVFLVGGNGSGKTTLAKLLTGLYEPEGGQLSWNGVAVSGQTGEEYRQLFSAVFSDFFLFDGLLGLTLPALDLRARELIGSLDLAHRVRIEQGTFSTTELSQGQRKRLALLVAELEDRPVVVFDEWAADQDPSYKELFYRHFLPGLRARGKAVLVITHDDRYFHLADRCIRLDCGRIVPGQDPQSASPPLAPLRLPHVAGLTPIPKGAET